MKLFFRDILFFLIASFLVLLLLDFIYSEIYRHPVHERNKVVWLKNLKKQHFDYALFGSSRCVSHLDPKQIELETGLKGINLGHQASYSFEIKLMVKEFLKTQHAEKIFIQVDDTYNNEGFHKLAIIPWMPFISENSIYSEISSVDNLAFFKKNIPFYKYMYYDSRIGFREMMMSFIKSSDLNKTMGFYEFSGMLNNNKKVFNYNLENKKNKHLEEIVQICKENNIQCYFFTAPYFNTTINTDVLKNNLTNYQDFSESITNPKLFGDHKHLNYEGSRVFTKMFILNFLQPKN